ncbi:hypothetical protein BDB01DRAFT_800729 [Pilobolus umbonatus]|nr:hypothetical protein BDB01DRAFT_800729 [Pilobolus umbonatus]
MENEENGLMDSFKATALKVTTLYKDALVQNKKSYHSGYQQALQDIYEWSMQNDVSASHLIQFLRQKSTDNKTIDPNTPFTFTHECPRSMDNVWDQAVVYDPTKRRPHPTDVSFMGRTLMNETEPPMKKNRR